MGLLRKTYPAKDDYSDDIEANDQMPLVCQPIPLKILIIEDNESDYLIAVKNLQLLDGYQVDISRACNLKEAFLAAKSKSFDIVFVDFWLGTETSVLAMKEFGGRFGNAALVLLSGMPGPDVRNIATKAGALHCIDKNLINPVLLESIIESALYTRKIEAKLTKSL